MNKQLVDYFYFNKYETGNIAGVIFVCDAFYTVSVCYIIPVPEFRNKILEILTNFE